MISPTARRISAAFTLVEVAMALGIAGFCLITVLGLVPLGVSTGQNASDQAVAGSILSHVLADLRATPMTSPPGSEAATSQEYKLSIPPNGASGAATTSVLYFGSAENQFTFSPTRTGSARYRLTAYFLAPAKDRTATHVTLVVTWPAQIDPSNPGAGTVSGRVQVYAGLDRN